MVSSSGSEVLTDMLIRSATDEAVEVALQLLA